MARILITGAGGPAGIALAEQFKHQHGGEHYLIGVDLLALPQAAAELFDEHHLVPAAADPGLLPALRRLVRRTRVDLIIPTVQDELPAVAAGAALLGAPVVSSPSHGVALAHDKLLTMATLAAAGVPIPHTLPADDLAASANLTFPMVLKPRVARGGRGVQVLDDPAELTDLLDEGLSPGLIAQEFAPGDEYAVQIFRQAGHPWECVVLAKTALKQGRVGNAAAVVRCPPGTELDVATVAIRAVEALGLHGPMDLDVRRLADGTPVVLEVNARFGANSAYAPELLERVLAQWLRAPARVVA